MRAVLRIRHYSIRTEDSYAVERHVSASTQTQAPVVLTREEVRRLLGAMSGTAQVVARLL
jgi:hypothetical protein